MPYKVCLRWNQLTLFEVGEVDGNLACQLDEPVPVTGGEGDRLHASGGSRPEGSPEVGVGLVVGHENSRLLPLDDEDDGGSIALQAGIEKLHEVAASPLGGGVGEEATPSRTRVQLFTSTRRGLSPARRKSSLLSPKDGSDRRRL